MAFSCECDEGPEWCRTEQRRAHKVHVCCECREEIKAGETYEHTVGKWEGDLSTFKTCERCSDLRKSYSAMGYCYTYGGLWEDHLDMLLGAPEKQQSKKAIELADRIVNGAQRERHGAQEVGESVDDRSNQQP